MRMGTKFATALLVVLGAVCAADTTIPAATATDLRYEEPSVTAEEADEVVAYAAKQQVNVEPEVARRFPRLVRVILETGPLCLEAKELEDAIRDLTARTQAERTLLVRRLDTARRQMFEVELQYQEVLRRLELEEGAANGSVAGRKM